MRRLAGAGGGGGLELGLVGLKVGLRELREGQLEGPVVAKDEGGVALEANVVLGGLDLDARGLCLGTFEGEVDKHGEGHLCNGAALRPAGRPLVALQSSSDGG